MQGCGISVAGSSGYSGPWSLSHSIADLRFISVMVAIVAVFGFWCAALKSVRAVPLFSGLNGMSALYCLRLLKLCVSWWWLCFRVYMWRRWRSWCGFILMPVLILLCHYLVPRSLFTGCSEYLCILNDILYHAWEVLVSPPCGHYKSFHSWGSSLNSSYKMFCRVVV